MVEAESHISAVCSEAYHHVVCARNAVLGFPDHVSLGVARLVFWHFVDKLPGSRPVLIDTGYVGAVFHFFVEHMHGEVEVVWSGCVNDVEAEAVSAFFGREEDIVGRVGAAVTAIDTPAVVLAGKGGVQRQLLHAVDVVDVVDTEIDGVDAVSASRDGCGA